MKKIKTDTKKLEEQLLSVLNSNLKILAQIKEIEATEPPEGKTKLDLMLELLNKETK